MHEGAQGPEGAVTCCQVSKRDVQHLIHQLGKGRHTINLPEFEMLMARSLENTQVTSADEAAGHMQGAAAAGGNANMSFQASMSYNSMA